jgi:hypothetical protein
LEDPGEDWNEELRMGLEGFGHLLMSEDDEKKEKQQMNLGSHF